MKTHSHTAVPSRLPAGGAPRRPQAAFTMVEIAICIAVVAFALVSIIGVMPTGLDVQKRNRENTLINQEGAFWLEALRGGAFGLDYLTNHVQEIFKIPRTPWPSRSRPPVEFFTNSPSTSVKKAFDSGREIIGLLSEPYVYDGRRVLEVTNTAFVRALTGSAAEKTYRSDFGFRYLLSVEMRPFSSVPPPSTNIVGGLTPEEGLRRTNLMWLSRLMQSNTYDLRVTLIWPLYEVGGRVKEGGNRKTFRALVGGTLTSSNDSQLGPLYWLHPQEFGFTNRLARLP